MILLASEEEKTGRKEKREACGISFILGRVGRKEGGGKNQEQ